ncbi:MAG: class I SAM-dependent methyltransferase [Flavisolibacter sp.]
MPSTRQHPSSYRDPSGFIFYHGNTLYRQVNAVFKEDFEGFMTGGLYEHLVGKQLLVPHKTIPQNLTGTPEWYQTIEPEYIRYISFPYEWSFDMLKDAALLTLGIAGEAMEFGMMLKDASAYNVQWHRGRMVFIDSLSFEKWDASQPWIAYHQFCEHFLAPLALMHYQQLPLQALLLAYPDGLPLPVVRNLLPGKSRLHLHTFLHLHLHARLSGRLQKTSRPPKPFSATKMKNLLRSLKETIQSFHLDQATGVWSGYYGEAIQRDDYVTRKKQIVDEWIGKLPVQSAIDLGANEGAFSELLASKGIYTISADADHYSINHLYKRIKDKIPNIHPLLMDLTHPSPGIGWNNEERPSFLNRTRTDLVLALALIHHLGIGKNVPFESMAKLFRGLGKGLILEFIPKEDEKVQLMLQQKKDIYDWYTKEHLEKVFLKYYRIIDAKEETSSKRTLYLMQAHEL